MVHDWESTTVPELMSSWQAASDAPWQEHPVFGFPHLKTYKAHRLLYTEQHLLVTLLIDHTTTSPPRNKLIVHNTLLVKRLQHCLPFWVILLDLHGSQQWWQLLHGGLSFTLENTQETWSFILCDNHLLHWWAHHWSSCSHCSAPRSAFLVQCVSRWNASSDPYWGRYGNCQWNSFSTTISV